MIVTGKTTITQAARDIRKSLLLVALVSVVLVGVHIPLAKTWVALNISTLTSLGVALSVYLSFRNNIVYQRFWEARGLWGRLINTSRTISRQIATFVTDDDNSTKLLREMACFQTAFVYAFAAHLRGTDARAEAARFLPTEEVPATKRNVPSALLQRMGVLIREAWKAGHITEFHLTRLDDSLTEMTDILGGCEKIKNTPLPPAYTYLNHKIVLAYCCLVPFGLIEELGYLTPVLTLIVSFAFLTLDHVSELIEQPFSTDPNDLPLYSMSRTIESDLLERVGKTPLPALEPEDGVLL